MLNNTPKQNVLHLDDAMLQVLVAVAVIATVWQCTSAGGHHGGGHGYAHSFAHFNGPVVGPAEPVHVGHGHCHGHGHGHAIDYVVSITGDMFSVIQMQIMLATRTKRCALTSPILRTVRFWALSSI